MAKFLCPWVRVIATLLAGMCLCATAAADEPPDSTLIATHLRCEYLENPLAVDAVRPRLSWELQAIDRAARGLNQTAYQVMVTTVPTALQLGTHELWNSGWIESSRTNQIEFGGRPLSPGQPVHWRVRVKDDSGGVSAWSGVASWTTGLIVPEAWSGAQWIGDPTPAPKDGFDPLPPPMLRREFSCPNGKRIERATVYASALGVYQLHINGRRVGDHELAPEWTDYAKRVQYQAYDTTDLLRSGENCIGAIVGDGWYAGKIGLTGIVPKGRPRAIYGRQPRLLVRLAIRFTDGTETTIVTDDAWRTTLEGPIRTADIMDGETYDAQREMKGWSEPGFEASSWKPALIADAPPAKLVAQPNEPIRINRESGGVKPIAITEVGGRSGVFVVDMGQNMVGWCRAKLGGTPGQPITLRHAEVLNPDGTIYTSNLRGAAQTDRYTPANDAESTFEPHFTYHGFRYVEITGARAKPALDAIVGRVVNSSAPEVGTFECSEPMLNRLWQNILWTQRGNLMGVPTDCPQRDERCGWMGDILAFAPTACFNMDMAAFFTKWVPDTRDAQATDGRFADFSPHPYDPNARFSGVPAWGDAGVFVPWAAYRFYGDTRILAEQYPAAVRWIEYVRALNPDHLWTHSRGNDYGDWLNADTLKLQGGRGWPAKGAEVPKHVFATILFYRSTQIVSEMASILGRGDDAKKYAAEADAIRKAFNKVYVTPEGVIEGDTQAGYALALQFGLLPENLQPAALQRMIDRFKPYDGQISTGFHSTLPLMEQLSARGRNDEAYRLLLNRKMPSWGYEIDHGATTIWERWDGYVEGRGYQDPGMNSFAHYAIGAVGEWIYDTMLGIRADSPGFESVVIHPHPGPGVTWAAGSYRSIRGLITCRWKQAKGEFRLSVSLPPNVSGRVILPASDAAKVQLNGALLSNAKGAGLAVPETGGLSVPVGSGTHSFIVRE